ncbi:MAG TPA: CDP-alcohol phosphatidyltransferase family protein [Legionellaceae bacterium]|nr:CDP-alcohol phosphatidyltransferase family protein [Legionellaceae bacterium]
MIRKKYNNMILKQIPNILTLIRLLLVLPFLLCLFHHEFVLAFYIFMIAGITDALDGWLARGFAWQSNFGKLLDPMADKLLIASSFISLAILSILPWWLVILVFARDLTISLGVLAWYMLIPKKPDLKPTYISKINTVMQLILVMLHLCDQAFSLHILPLLELCSFLTALTTTASFIDYVWTWGKKACQQTICPR